MRERQLLSLDWHFYEGDRPACVMQDIPGTYETVTIPHDYVIGRKAEADCPFGNAQGFRRRWGVVYYTRQFTCQDLSQEEQLYLDFDGVYENCTVYLNGEEVGGHGYGYTSFSLEITPFVREGENRLALRVDNSQMPPDRWYSGGGIYRPVYLRRVHRVHVIEDSVFVRTVEMKDNVAQLAVSLQTTGGDFVKIAAATSLGTVVGKTVPCGRQKGDVVLMVEHPILWSRESPFLYELQLQVVQDGEVTDRYTVPFGIRKVEMDGEEGLRVNGRPLKLKGVNMHHDLGGLGSAVSSHALRRRLEKLRELGCNAIRMSHNPPASQLLDLCDQMGFYVVDEALDKWVSGSYERYYPRYAKEDVAAMVCRDRNHPCVLIWSVGNEVEDQGSEEMLKRLGDLTKVVRELDESRPVTYAMIGTYLNGRAQTSQEKAESVQKIAEYVDVISCNYQEQWYHLFHRDTPGKPILGTEIFPYFRGKGELQMAYYDRCPWWDVEENPYVIGGFVWAGFDYLGEASAWPAKGWTGTLMDTLGNRNPVSYLWESMWSDQPVVHITFLDGKKRGDLEHSHWSAPKTSSHWNFSEYGEAVMPFQIYTNCESVSVWLQGQCYQVLEKKDSPNGILTGFLPYLPGTVEVKGLKGGEEVCSHLLRTAGRPCRLEASLDRSQIQADGVDVVYADVRVVDEQGVLCPNGDNLIRFSLSGPGLIQCVDNGDLLSGHSYHDNQVNAFHGRCACVVKSLPQSGEIQLAVSADGMESVYLTLPSVQDSELEGEKA